MNKNQDHEGLVEKSKDDNSNLPLTEGEEAHSPSSFPRFELPSSWRTGASGFFNNGFYYVFCRFHLSNFNAVPESEAYVLKVVLNSLLRRGFNNVENEMVQN